MKCKVTHSFRDKDNFSIIYKVGETVDFEEARALSLANRKLVVVIEEKKEEDVPQAQTLFPTEEEQEHVAEVNEEVEEPINDNAEENEVAQVLENEDTNVEANEEVEEPLQVEEEPKVEETVEEPSQVEEEPKVEETVEETPIEEKPKRGRKKNA